MDIATVDIDLAKNVFVLHGIGQSGKAVFIKPKVARSQLLEMVGHLPPCLIGMEACSGVHYWAREFSRYGHTVKLMAPKWVTRRLGWTRPRPIQQWRQGPLRQDHQGGRRLPAQSACHGHPIGSRRTGRGVLSPLDTVH